MADQTTLSEAAQALLRRRLAGERIPGTDETRPAYRELVAAGIMYPVSTFARGPEASFRFTEEGWDRRHEWIDVAALPRESP